MSVDGPGYKVDVVHGRLAGISVYKPGESGIKDAAQLRMRNRAAVQAERQRLLSEYTPQNDEWRVGIPDSHVMGVQGGDA